MFVVAFAMIAAAPAEIVVNGRRLSDYRARLDACIARGCPPDEDIAATLAAAEIAFLGGRTRIARSIVYRSIERNRRHALTQPDGVAGLYRAYANVQRSLGDEEHYRHAAWRAYLTYRNAPSTPAAKRLDAKIDVAAMQMNTARFYEALDLLTGVSREASAKGLPVIAAFADLQCAKILYYFRRTKRSDDLLRDVAARPGPDVAFIRLGARLALLHQASPGKKPDIGLLANDSEGLPEGGPRLLVWTPPAVSDTSPLASGSATDGQWADIAFHIRPDGRVEDVRLLKSSSGEEAAWVTRKIADIADWLYTPNREPGGDDRVIHFAFTSYSANVSKGGTAFTSGFASRLPSHAGVTHLEQLDISPSPEEGD